MADDDATGRRTTKATARKTTAKKSGASRAAPVKRTARKATAAPQKAAAKKAAVKKAAVKKAPVKATAKAPAKKAAAKRTTAATPGTRDAGAILAPRKKAPPRLRLAAEETFDDDWRPPEPEPVRDDPSARMRAVLRAAARSLEEKESGPQTPRPSPAPPPVDEPVTRVLVAPEPEPEPEDEDEWMVEDEVEDEVPAEAEDEWAPPEQLDDPRPLAPPPPAPPAQPPPPPPPVHRAPEAEVTVPPAPPVARADKKERKRRRPILAVVLALIVLLAAAAVVGFLLAREEGVDYSELKVGDCFDSAQSAEIRTIEVKPCTEPHNSEIFFLVTHPAGPGEPFPGTDTLVQFAADACLGQPFTEYVGVPLEQSQLRDFEIVPKESRWKDGKRVLVCGVDTGDQGKITESIKGSRR